VKPKILVVDDVEANLIALDAALDKMPCELVRARSGNEALKALLHHEFAVMLLDVQMAGMDGYEVARLARGNLATRDVPIVFVTAMHQTEENALKGYGAGAVDFLFKPFNPEILRSKVAVFLELYESRRALAEAVEANKVTMAELDAFNYSVSHDLRAPLRPLDGFSVALLEDYGDKLDDAGRDYLLRIRAAAHRMSQLIDDLLQLSRMTRTEMIRGEVDLAKLAKDTIDELRANEPGRHVEFVCLEDAKVEGDARLLRIALENLLRNAWKFSAKVAHARIELGKKDDAFFVRDNGAGFDKAHAGRLFQPFQRMHSSAQFEGTGIGLAIVQRIVRRHGGTIWAEAAVDQGATFFFQVA
jgi:two-component system sensor histidine kinase/response regulator